METFLIRVNRAIAMKRLRRVADMNEELDFLEQNGYTGIPFAGAGIAALRQDRHAMFAALDEAFPSTITVEHLKEFPVFEDYRDDPDFIKLITSEET